jgi:hypothetical protein
MLHLFANGHFGMVFEHLQDCFHLEDFASGLPHMCKLCFHIAQGHIPC